MGRRICRSKAPGSPGSIVLLITTAFLLTCCGGSDPNDITGSEEDESSEANTQKTTENLTIGPNQGMKAPAFTLTSLDGKEVSLASLKDRPVFLNFWATWCGPCVAEMPDIETLQKKHGDKITIIGIDLRESTQTVSQFVSARDYSWTFVIDTSGSVAQKYLVEAIPTSIFINSKGVITARKVGLMQLSAMETLAMAAIGTN